MAERRSILLGLNPPLGHAVRVVQHEPATKPTSTQEIRGLLDDVMRITPRERELLDRRELDGDGSAEVLAEINELRAQRGKPPMAADGTEAGISVPKSLKALPVFLFASILPLLD